MRRRAFGFLGIVVLAGCGVVLGLDPPAYDERVAPPEAGPETSTIEAGPSNPPGRLDDPSRWSTYRGAGGSWVTGPFDGKYIYFLRASDPDGPDAGETATRLLRYDTTAARFDDPGAWVSVDLETVYGVPGGHSAAVMDGPYLIIAGSAGGRFIRYDTRLPADFGFPTAAWQVLPAGHLGPNATAYNTALPINGGGALFTNSTLLTPVTHKGEDFDGGWTTAAPFDAGTFGCGATQEGACVGSDILLGPAGGAGSSCLARWNQAKPFTDQASWESFDVATLGAEFGYLLGTIRTDQHVYFTQYNTADAAAPVRLMRRPLTGALDAGWEAQPTNVKNPLTRGFIGGAYDGRFLYLSPYPVGTQNVIYTRYDTQGGFGDGAAWDVVAGAALGIPANRSWGAVFDGQYVYYPSFTALGGENANVFARFKAYDAKIPVPPVCR